MVNPKLVTCSLCDNYYNDPRQIPCSHSFCFHCISVLFNETNSSLICPKCDKTHHYQSRDEFNELSMRNGNLATLVMKFKKSRSRTPGIDSTRPDSSLSINAPMTSSTPFQSISITSNSSRNLEQSDSERPTPLVFLPTTPSDPGTFTAKCQACSNRAVLVVCSHCENVICVKCRDEHILAFNALKTEWETCKQRYEQIHYDSLHFENKRDECLNHCRSLQSSVRQQSEDILKKIEQEKQNYLNQIESHRQLCRKEFYAERITDMHDFIQKSIDTVLNSSENTPEKVEDILFEIEQFEQNLDSLILEIENEELEFPVLTKPDDSDVLSILGQLEFQRDKVESVPRKLNSIDLIEETQITSNKYSENHFLTINKENPPEKNETPPKKKTIWQIEYVSVPYYVRIWSNLLFVCDRFGSLSIYKFNKLNDRTQKPTKQADYNLFKESQSAPSSDEDQLIIDSFTVHKLWIIVFRRRKNELHGTIHLFSHDGKSIVNGRFSHKYPSRELTIDPDINRLWSLDQKQLCFAYYDLPETKVSNPEECFNDRKLYIHLSKPCAPIHISVNKNALAVLDRNEQKIHVFDKKNKQKLYEYANVHLGTTHVCWDVALFNDNSLLIKLDETSTLRTGPSKHIYYHLDSKNENKRIGMIEETDAYGMMITPNDEIFIGVRINARGIIKCYV